ncbi:MAG: respiratory nitrate reductase subunit gamma [Limnospira sp. PMC 894.15]|uniref:Respiratory nitrate reductase subunit gamma n=1 Tax=Limnospira fusiformis PMC 851.14 TaxID=2219512 RepID=A0ABU9ERZ2_LIMFS|nr:MULTISPECIES: respiratory nitrate reductase subunit gamma [Limnospira]MDT9186479.1 respiratory nitrate reductase subunit gamma [Limnospira sp. PMC 894.15]MDT9232347.1 respiratory nitrate reductase subunit gamma [Limnospira sp. PMC 917.15]MDT9273135.1 respiratory nitrate reductase subunit gamma [Limnospira sp. PMC 737.11]QNH58113.1 MAG: respiratory nitrate reductase subunit gamma [Limnospira indica BM01]
MAFLTFFGLIMLMIRRAFPPRISAITSVMDVVLLVGLFVQVVAGIWTAIFYGWGSSWYAGAAVPYLWSVLQFNPNISLVENLPLMVKVHIVGAFSLVGLFPFTRLVHFLSLPIQYIWRSPQVVVGNQSVGAVTHSESKL